MANSVKLMYSQQQRLKYSQNAGKSVLQYQAFTNNMKEQND